MERLAYIDSLKGIGIILVVMGHFFIPYTDYLNDPVNQVVYSFHMPLFFFLSGLVYGHVPKDSLKIFLVKKTLSLLFPYLFFSLLYCFIKNYTWTSLLLDNELHGGYWFTMTLFFVMLLNHIIDRSVKTQNAYIRVIVQIVLTTVLLLVAKFEVVPVAFSAVISFDKIAKYYLYFQLGKFIMQSAWIKSVIENDITITVLILVYLYVFCRYGYTLDSVNIFSFVLSICGVCVVYNIVLKNQKLFYANGFLPFLGRKSLEIYLTHFLLLHVIPHEIVSGFGVIYIQIIILLLLSMSIIVISLVVSYILSRSSLFSLLLYGKGKYAKQIIGYIK